MSNFHWVKGGSTDGQRGYLLYFDYDEEVIECIKNTILSHLRQWQPDEKRWWVHESCEKQIDDIFKGFIEAVQAQLTLF